MQGPFILEPRCIVCPSCLFSVDRRPSPLVKRVPDQDSSIRKTPDSCSSALMIDCVVFARIHWVGAHMSKP